MERLPLETRTLYMELMEQMTALDARRTLGSVPGSYVQKTVKGHKYVYFQFSEPGGKTRQAYLGPLDEHLKKLMQHHDREREILAPEKERIRILCSQLRAGGCLTTGACQARVLKSISDAGLFHLEAILVGTLAFIVMGNILGTRWGSALKTEDIDIAAPKKMTIATPRHDINLPGVLEQLDMGFLHMPSLNQKHPSTSFKVRGEALRVDLITHGSLKEDPDPVSIPRFNTAAQPVPFLSYLLDHPVRGAVVDGDGVLVSVPDPSRFALYKILLTRERAITDSAKSEKDSTQAAQLIIILADERPGDLALACQDLNDRGREWRCQASRA